MSLGKICTNPRDHIAIDRKVRMGWVDLRIIREADVGSERSYKQSWKLRTEDVDSTVRPKLTYNVWYS